MLLLRWPYLPFSYFSLPYLTLSRHPYRRVYVNPEVFYEMEVRTIRRRRRTITATELRAHTLSLLFCSSHCVYLSHAIFHLIFSIVVNTFISFSCRHMSHCSSDSLLIALHLIWIQPTTLHSIPVLYTTLPFAALHTTSLPFTTLHYTTLHCIT